MTFDTKCFDLAAHFLSDEPELNTPSNTHDLAAEIQATVESWFEDKKPGAGPSDVSGAVK